MVSQASSGAGPSLAERFVGLSALLSEHRALWEHRPFVDVDVPWRAAWPETFEWLSGLPSEAIDGLERDLALPTDAPRPLRALADRAASLTSLPRVTSETPPEARDPRVRWRVPGRKLSQISAFAGVVLARWPRPERWVDWCAGKGHLGRLLTVASGRPTVHVERERLLCEAGAALSERLGVRGRFVTSDVHAPAAWAEVGPDVAGVALHACGALGDRLLEQALERSAAGVALAPCCYHKLAAGQEVYLPRSRAGREHDLRLDRGLLRLPTADDVVARRSRSRRRRHEHAYRQGIDLLIREGSGVDAYNPLGPLSRDLLDLPFGRFVEEVARRRDLPLPRRWDPGSAEAAGRDRSRRARGLGLARAILRRPLELWCVLDRALMLAEAGRDVAVGTFCDRSLTPRNLVLLAA